VLELHTEELKGTKKMKTLTAALFAGTLMIASPLALADDLVISPDVGIHFHNDVKVKKYKSHKWDGDLKVGVAVPSDIEYYDIPEDVIVATPALKNHRYVYLNDHVYIVDSEGKIVAIVD
jgi:hypothetical protein